MLTPDSLIVNIDGRVHNFTSQIELDINAVAGGRAGDGFWDDITTDYRVAATRAGLDFFVYAVTPSAGAALSSSDLILSANSTVPTGFTAANSRKVAGFHSLCLDVGTIGGHTLTGYLTGDVLPQSVWDLNFRADNLNLDNTGLTYDPGTGVWVFIYLASGTGGSTTSVSGGTISDARIWLDFNDDGAAIGMRLPEDSEFQSLAAGSNEETNIVGSADPGTTGSHVDTATRRMVSDIGCEDCCGVMWQWLLNQSYRQDGAATFSWEDLPGVKGGFFKQGDIGDVLITAGGNWSNGTDAGSRSRNAFRQRWFSDDFVGARYVVRSLRR